MNLQTVELDEQRCELVLLDQTKLPGEVVYLHLSKKEEIWEAIYRLCVRGAPAIGLAAAIGLYVLAARLPEDERFAQQVEKLADYIGSSRPTAVNLFWCLDRMREVLAQHPGAPVAELKRLLRARALELKQQDTDVCARMAAHGLGLIRDGASILTHCNAGQLATSKYGTALGPIHLGVERGMRFKVFCDETRPLLQGARLTAFEMQAAGVDTTLICDNMASVVMKNGWVDAVFVGCDRMAANGDAANKIGTSGLAVLAKYYEIPFYIFVPVSTIDPGCPDGSCIKIEQRDPDEVCEMWYRERMAPRGVKAFNPAFDVTDASLITGIVTEYGVLRPPFEESIAWALRQGEENR